MSTNASNNKLLSSLNQWCARLDCHDLAFRFTALPTPAPNKTYRLSKTTVKQFVKVTKGSPRFTIAYDADLVPTITLHTFKASIDGEQYIGSAIDSKTLCDSNYSDLSDIEPPAAKGEKVISASNAVFNAVKAHVAASLLNPKKQIPNRYLADKGLSNSDWSLHFQGVPIYLPEDESKVYRNGLYVPFFDVNHELTAYQLIIDMYEVPKTKRRGKFLVETGDFTASEYTPTARYVKSPKRFFTEFEGGKAGAYSVIGNEYDPQQGEIFVLEGLATAISFLRTRPAACGVISGSAGNTSPCVQTLLNQANKGEFEGLKRIVICADNDIVTFHRMQENGNAQACNAGIYAGVQAYIAHKDNALGVDIALCSIPNDVALNHAATDFDDYRQHLATVGKTLSDWQHYQRDVAQLLNNPLEFCSESKANALCGNEIVRRAIQRALLSNYFGEMGAFTHKMQINERHLSKGVNTESLLNTKGLIFIKSPMGTGKTVFIERYFEKLQQRGETGLYMCPSRALTRQMRDSLRNAGLKVVHYKDAGGRDLTLVTDIIGITTINSVWHFDGVKPHTVVIDESEQLLPVITSSIIEFPQSTSDILTTLCLNAHNVIVCDAQMSKFSVETMQRIKPNVDSLLIHNTFMTAKNKRVTMLSSKGAFWAKFEELLKAGKKVYVSTTSKQEARALSEFMKNRYPSITCLTLVANDDDDVTLLATLENINNEVLKYQVVIASPVVSSGVSIDNTHFDVVMGYYLPHNQSTPSLVTAVQQLGRVRKVKELYVFFQDRQSPKLETAPAKLLKYKEHELRYVAIPKRGYDAVTGAVTVVTTYPNHVLLDYANKAKQNLLDRSQLESFLFLLREEGYQIAFEPENPVASKQGGLLRAEYRDIAETKQHNAIAAAPEILIEQVAELERAHLKTKEEYLSMAKAKACDFMGIASKDFTAAHSELWASGLQSKVERLELLKTHDDLVSKRDIEAYETAVEKSTELTTFESKQAQKWILETVHAAYFDEEGNHYPNVCNTSPSVIKARDTLLSDKTLLKSRGVNVGQLLIKPLKVLCEQMKGMGYDVSCTKARIDGKYVRYYTAALNPDIACVLQRREQLGIATHLDNSVHSECAPPQICGMGKWENISLGENDNFPCHKTAQVERVIAFFATNRDKF
jgi:hypothetical protein